MRKIAILVAALVNCSAATAHVNNELHYHADDDMSSFISLAVVLALITSGLLFRYLGK